ncbi:hypothetical protein GCM10027190_31620 [Spirosoma areae]
MCILRCELEKGWHIDELEPIQCNKKWDQKKRKWVYDGTCKHSDRLHVNNKSPACASCDINKHSMSLEEFRTLIGGFLNSLNRDSTQNKIAKRYGFVEEVEKPVVLLRNIQ